MPLVGSCNRERLERKIIFSFKTLCSLESTFLLRESTRILNFSCPKLLSTRLATSASFLSFLPWRIASFHFLFFLSFFPIRHADLSPATVSHAPLCVLLTLLALCSSRTEERKCTAEVHLTRYFVTSGRVLLIVLALCSSRTKERV